MVRQRGVEYDFLACYGVDEGCYDFHEGPDVPWDCERMVSGVFRF